MATIIRRQSTFWDFHTEASFLRIHFSGKQAFRFISEEFDSIFIFTEHPVLLDYRYPWLNVYLASAPPDAADFLRQLASAVSNQVGPWKSLKDYINTSFSSHIELVRCGYGLLFHAPAPLVEKLLPIFDSSGVRHSVLEGGPPSGSVTAKALIAGRSFVIANAFRFENLTDTGRSRRNGQLPDR